MGIGKISKSTARERQIVFGFAGGIVGSALLLYWLFPIEFDRWDGTPAKGIELFLLQLGATFIGGTIVYGAMWLARSIRWAIRQLTKPDSNHRGKTLVKEQSIGENQNQ